MLISAYIYLQLWILWIKLSLVATKNSLDANYFKEKGIKIN